MSESINNDFQEVEKQKPAEASENISTQENTSKKDVEENQLDNKNTENEIIEEEDKLNIFVKNDIIGGYSIAVRDNWGFKILRRHISDREKELYIQEFGETLIKDDEFFTWWCKVNDINELDLTEESRSHQALYGNYGYSF